MVMAAGTLLSQAVVKYQLTPVLGRAFLRTLLWCETKGISLKCCCLASQACVWALVVGRDCSTSTKCCCYFCVCLSWQMHFGVTRKSSGLDVKPLFLLCLHLGTPSHVVWTPTCPIGLCNHRVLGDHREEKCLFTSQKPPCIVKAAALEF